MSKGTDSLWLPFSLETIKWQVFYLSKKAVAASSSNIYDSCWLSIHCHCSCKFQACTSHHQVTLPQYSLLDFFPWQNYIISLWIWVPFFMSVIEGRGFYIPFRWRVIVSTFNFIHRNSTLRKGMWIDIRESNFFLFFSSVFLIFSNINSKSALCCCLWRKPTSLVAVLVSL